MTRFPEVRALARAAAAIVLSAAALGASPAAAATITLSDSPFSGDQTVCPRANAAPATPIPVNQFQLTADAPANVARVLVNLVPTGSFANLERVEIRAVDPVGVGTLYGSIIPTADLFYVNMATPLPVGPVAAAYRVTIVPRRHQDMPPPSSGKAFAVRAQVTGLLAYGHVVNGSDLASATVTVDNASPANVVWSGVTSGASITLNWTAAANVVVLRRELAPVEDVPVEGDGSYATNGTLGTSSIVYAGNAASSGGGTVTAGRPYYYKVFTRSNNTCNNYSSGAVIGPIFAGGTSEGDVATPARLGGTPSTKPVIGIVSPGNGPATRPFKVKIRVFSPNTTPITEVRLYGNQSGTEELLGTSVGAGALVTRNANYDEGRPVDPASGFYEFTAPANFTPGNWTLRAWAANVASPTLAQGVYSAAVGVVVGANVGDGKLLVRDNASQLCADCHQEKSHSSEQVGMNYGSWYVGCRGCHDPHGTTNAKLIAKEITPPGYNGVQAPQQIYYTGAAGNVDGGKVNPSGTGLCQACHQRTAVYTRGAINQTHGDGQPCADCHKHADGMAKNCSSCHGTATRQPGAGVTGTDTLLTAAPPRTPTTTAPIVANGGMHDSHVNSNTFRRDLGALACSQCHLSYQHADSDVDLGWGPLAVGSGTKVVTPTPLVGPTTTAWVATPSCTNYCHGASLADGFTASKVAVSWGTLTPMVCGSCHGVPPNIAPHTSSTATCDGCHPTGYSLTTVAANTHIDGVVQASGCNGCHGSVTNYAPPSRAIIGGVNQTAASDANAIGKHQAHVVNSTFMPAPLGCGDCHASYPASGHQTDGRGTMAFSALGTDGGAMGATYQGQTTPANPTCTSVYCHAGAAGGSAPAPRWDTGTAMNCASCHGNPPAHPHPGNTTCASCHPSAGGETYARTGATTGTVVRATHLERNVNRSTSGCTSCHGTLTASGVNLVLNTVQAAPAYDLTGSYDTVGGSTSASPGVGAHRTHLTATRIRTGGAAVCADCHTLPPTDTDTAHAQDAGTGGARAMVAIASFGGLTGSYGGSTSGTGGSTAGTCASTYCHGGKYTTAPYQGATPAPSWSGTAMTCGSCHLGPPTTHTYVSTTTDCGTCHSGWTTCVMSNQAACGIPNTHLNGTFEAVSTTCTSCHGGVNPAPPVAAVKSPVGPNAVGAHQSHVTTGNIANALTCDACHIPVTQLTSANHNNGTVNTQFTVAPGTGTSWSGGAAGTSNCSASWCHGGAASQSQWGRAMGNPLWNTVDGSYQTCTACHGSPPALNAGTHHPPNTTTACTVCHGAGYASPTITGATALGQHVNGTIEYRAGCTGCHGDVTATGVAATDNRAAPGFNANAIDISGATSGTRVGAHLAHLSGTRLRTTTLACGQCHTVPADLAHADGAGNSTGARANVGMPGSLANGTVAGGTNTNPSYASPNCSSVYCHGARYVGRTGYTGTNMAPGWTQTTAQAATCGTCHAAAPTAGTTHTNANAGTEACSVCHTTYVNCTKSDNFATCQIPVEHMNGTFDAPAGGCGMCHGNPPATITLTAPFVGATHPQNPVCGSCHGAGYNTTDYASLPGSHGGTTVPGTDAPQNGCTACHGVLAGPTAAAVTDNTLASNAPGYWVSGTTFGVDSAGSTATSYTAVGAHDAHVRKTNLRSAALACTQCHYGSVMPAAGNVSHANGTAQTAFDPALAASAGAVTWNGTTCSATYCHGNFTNGAARLPAPSAPAAPGAAPTFASVTSSSLTVNWTASTGATVYKILRSTTSGSGYVQVGSTTATTFGDVGLSPSTPYYYVIRAWNTGGESGNSAQGTATTTAAGVATRYDFGPATATNVGTDGTTTITNQTSYTYNTTATVPSVRSLGVLNLTLSTAQGRVYGNFNPSANTTYYMVSLYTPALDASNNSVAAAVPVSIDYTNRTTNNGGIGNFIATLYEYNDTTGDVGAAKGTYTSANISQASTTTQYTVSGTIGNGAFQVAPGNRLKVVITLRMGGTRTGDTCFLFGANRANVGTAGLSEGYSMITPTLAAAANPAPTAAPTNLTFSNVGSSSLTLTWNAVSGATTYHVERGVGATPASWAQVAETSATSIDDLGLAGNTTYSYRVTASTAAGNGPVSATATQATPALPPPGSPTWAGSYSPAGTTLTCTSCHGSPPGGTHPANAVCANCHPNYSATTVDAAVHINGVINVDCVGCHSSTQNHRDPVAGEFSLTWSHKKSAAGQTVTKWDCIVCHMEGNPADGERVAVVHGDGNINLRDPDTGNNIKQVVFTGARGNTSAGSYGPVAGDPDMVFTTFRRNLAVALDNDPDAARVQAIMVNQCLKCHDVNGATAIATGQPLANLLTAGAVTRSPGKPFGATIAGAGYNGNASESTIANGGTYNTACNTTSGTATVNGCVANVKDSFATGNSSYHPVLGRNNNWFARATRMVTPWNLAKINTTTANATEYGFLMSCWDCHATPTDSGTITRTVTAHGGTDTLRGTATVTGTPSTTNAVTLCVKCHANYNNTGTTYSHGTNSAFATSTGRSVKAPYLQYGCNLCHSSGFRTSTVATRPVVAKNSHGVNALPSYTTGAVTLSGRWASATVANKRPFAFIRAIDTLGDHEPRVAAGTTLSTASTCDMLGSATGGPNCNQGQENLGPGGTY